MITRYAFLLFSASLTFPAFSQLVINEVDYDQPGSDNAEFIELKNTGTVAFPLSNIAILMANGSSGTAVVYHTYSSDIWPMLAPGAYFTLCGDTTAGCDANLAAATNNIQNGTSDGIAVIDLTDSTVIDMLGYEGTLPGFTEGTGTTIADDNNNANRSIGRFPDGADTDNNEADFHLMCSTPGAANVGDTTDCGIPTGVHALVAPSNFTLMADPGNDRVLMACAPANGQVTFDVFSVDGSLLASHKMTATGKATWAWYAGDRHGRMLIVRVSSANGVQAKRVVLP